VAKKIRSLSRSAELEIQRLLSRVLALEQSQGIGPRAPRQATAHYIVRTPSGGIPAATGDPVEPGAAECVLHRRMTDGDDHLEDLGRNQVVRNFETTAIPGDKLILAHRDAWGDMWAQLASGDCEELSPGSYRGVCGATIAPGESGPVIVTGCDGDETLDAVNHSNCTFYLGDRITVNVDPCCEVHFTGCSCCGSEPSPPDCCDISIVICIAGESKILSVDGGTYTWDVSECCDCVGATFEVALSCVDGEITADWTYTCSGTTTGDIDLTALCDFENDVEILGELTEICGGNLNDRWANFVADCEPCGDEPPPPCDLCTQPGVQDEDDGGNPLGVSFTSFPNVVCCEDSFSLVFQDVDQGADTLIEGTFFGTLVTITNLGGGTLISGGNGATDSFLIDFGASAARTLTITVSLGECTQAIYASVVGGIFANDGRTRIDWAVNPCE